MIFDQLQDELCLLASKPVTNKLLIPTNITRFFEVTCILKGTCIKTIFFQQWVRIIFIFFSEKVKNNLNDLKVPSSVIIYIVTSVTVQNDPNQV
jgi:hypothetical protein